MARGKKSLIETTNLPIEKTDKEEGQIPYFIIDDEWGVSCDERNEILVHKRLANRTIKDENNIDTYIEQYYSWESICYTSNFTTAIDIYANKKEKEKKSKLIKTKDYKDVIKIQEEIKEIIQEALSFENSKNKEYLSTTSIIDKRAKLEEEILLLKETKEEVEKETEKLLKMIKEKNKIIINSEPSGKTKKNIKKLEEETE